MGCASAPARRRALGDHLFAEFVESKRIEWNACRSQVHQYKLGRCLSVL